MRIIEYFDKIRIINLPTRPDRRRQITRDFGRHRMPVNGGKVEYFDAIRREDDGGFETAGMHGCFLSHLGVLKQARAAGLSRIVHVEDDLQLSRKFDVYEEALVDQLRERRWDMAYFGHVVPGLDPATAPAWVPHPSHERIELFHFVGINGTIFDRLIDFFESILTRPPGHPDGGPMPPDGGLSFFRARNPEVVALVANPSLGWQRRSRTDAHPLRWFDRTPLVKELVAVARQCRSWSIAEP